MFSTRDDFFDEPSRPGTGENRQPYGGGSGFDRDYDEDMIVPRSNTGTAGLVPSRDYGSDSSDEDLMPGAAVAPIPQPQSTRQVDRAAQMQKMQMQARMARGQLNGGGAMGGRRPMGGMMSATGGDDEFSVRPQSRGISGIMSQRRGPLTQVNGQDVLGSYDGGSSLGSSSTPALQAVSQTEQQLAAMGLSTSFDPSLPKGFSERGGNHTASSSRDGGGGNSRAFSAPAPAPMMASTDIRGLLNKVPPPDTTVQCYILRKKKGLLKAFPEYKLYLQQGEAGQVDKFLLSGRKRKKQKVSNYLISLDEEDMAKASGNYYGKVKSNFVGTEFSFYDKGSKPEEVAQTGEGLANPRKELGVVMYDTNVLGTKGPRKMTVHVPIVSPQGHVQAKPSTTGGQSMLDAVKSGAMQDTVRLTNKEPRWNESLGAYCLNFNGRVTLPSVKNFQLQMEGAQDPNQVSLQFGKTGENTFSMDYSYPLCPLQAFQIVLSSFDHKWACE